MPNNPSAPYGFCPECGQPGTVRARDMVGTTFCANNHKWIPSAPAEPTFGICPRCKGGMVYDPTLRPCPGGLPSCLVAHMGPSYCPRCNPPTLLTPAEPPLREVATRYENACATLTEVEDNPLADDGAQRNAWDLAAATCKAALEAFDEMCMPSEVLALFDERESLLSRVTALEAVVERDRTRFGIWIDRLRAEVRSRRGISQSRGSYEWDDESYMKEFGAALDSIDKALDRVFSEVHVRDLTDSPTTQAAVDAARSRLSSSGEDDTND